MATLHLRRFSDPGALKTIRPEYLKEFLGRFSLYFAKRGLILADGPIDYEALAGILVSPDESTPAELLDALYLVHESADEEAMQALLAANAAQPPGARVDFSDTAELTPADVAVRMWLRAPRLLEKTHEGQHLTDRRAFQYFASREAPRGAFVLPSPAKVDALERELGEWFFERKKGREGEKARVFPYRRQDGVWFLVRHGGVFRREGAIRDGESSSVFFRPEEHDILVYNDVLGELRINARSKGERKLYREAFGHHLFGNRDHFPDTGRKYTLDPLREGPESIVCSDVEGMEWVRLVEVSYQLGALVRIEQADDLFSVLADSNRTIYPKARIVGARFRVKFRNSRAPRTVALRIPNVARFTRDEDGSLIEVWLDRRRFALPREEGPREEHAEVLAIA